MIRVIEARQLIARIDDKELYEKLSEFVGDVHDVLLKVDRSLSVHNWPPTREGEVDSTHHKVRALLSFELWED